MRITYVTHYPELYGANRSLLDLMRELRERGEVQPHVLLPRDGGLAEVLTQEKIPFRVVPFEPWMSERRYEGRPHHRFMQWLRYERAARKAWEKESHGMSATDIANQLNSNTLVTEAPVAFAKFAENYSSVLNTQFSIPSFEALSTGESVAADPPPLPDAPSPKPKGGKS